MAENDNGNAATAEGNRYVMDFTVGGDRTFRHVSTGEVLHGQVGPWREAWQLYIGPSGLAQASGERVLYDLGLGCGAHVLAAIEAFHANTALTRLDVVSFDLEKSGLVTLRENLEHYDYARPHADLLDRMIAHDALEVRTADGRIAAWRFVKGDFRETIRAGFEEAAGMAPLPLADVVFFDFFSPARHPWMWRLEVMDALFARTSERAMLFTYSGATCGRATLCAAGFYMGFGEPSGSKAKSTIAARRLADLDCPFPTRWKDTFLASHKPFLDGENDGARELIRVRIVLHPQFRSENPFR